MTRHYRNTNMRHTIPEQDVPKLVNLIRAAALLKNASTEQEAELAQRQVVGAFTLLQQEDKS